MREENRGQERTGRTKDNILKRKRKGGEQKQNRKNINKNRQKHR